MAATLQSLNVALQRVWTQKTLEEQLYQETPFLDKLKKKDTYTVGETARVPLHVSRNGGYTALPDGGGELNPAGNQGLAKAEFNYTNHHQPIAIQGDAIDGTKGDTNAIVEAADVEIKGALTDLNRQLTRQLFMDGSALITPCAASTGNTVELDPVLGQSALERGWLFINQPIIIGSKASEQSVSTTVRTVTGFEEGATPKLTVSGAAVTTETATDYVSQSKSRTGEVSYEMNGLKNVVSETLSLGKLSPATEPTWKATVNSTSGPLSLALLLTAKRRVNQKRGKSPNFLLTSLKQQAKFYELLQQQARYVGGDDSLNAGGDQKVKWDSMDIWADPDCPDPELYMGRYEHFFMLALDKPYWQNKVTGGEILQWRLGTDEYQAKVTYRCNLGANRRNDLYRFSALT